MVEVRVLDLVVDIGVFSCVLQVAVDDETPILALEETIVLPWLLVTVVETPALAVEETVALLLLLVAVSETPGLAVEVTVTLLLLLVAVGDPSCWM